MTPKHPDKTRKFKNDLFTATFTHKKLPHTDGLSTTVETPSNSVTTDIPDEYHASREAYSSRQQLTASQII